MDSYDSTASIASSLQSKVDNHHLDSIQRSNDEITSINKELREIIHPLKSQFTDLIQKQKEWPCDLHEIFESHEMQKLEQLYQDSQHLEETESNEQAKKRTLLPSGNLEKIEKAQVEKILQEIDLMADGKSDKVTETTQQLTLATQLYITITDIIRRMNEKECNASERLAQATRS